MGRVGGAHASFIGCLVVHKLKRHVNPKFLHLGVPRGPHGRSMHFVRGPPEGLNQTRENRRLAARFNLTKNVTRPARGQDFQNFKSFVIMIRIW
ncbi:hypothetical protein HanRHA438_Chr01g0033631 [Helianthus annuus]|nr:hypothetical protein HanRHA438_Chr01g0033631 [Helianthus annuus]